MRKVFLVAVFGFLVASSTYITLLAEPLDNRIDFSRNQLLDDSAVSIMKLSAAQREKVKRLKHSFQNEITPILSQKHEEQAALRKLWMQSKPDLEKIKSKQKEIHNLIWRLTEREIECCLVFRDILAPQQLSLFLKNRCNMDYTYEFK